MAAMSDKAATLEKFRTLNVYRRGERRAPHKPLLMLAAISALLQGKRELPFGEVERTLLPLLDAYAPPVARNHEPKNPYWYLQSDGLWVVPGADTFELTAGGFPSMKALRASAGYLPGGVAEALLADESFRVSAIRSLLEPYFPYSLHDDILEAVGLSLPAGSGVGETPAEYTVRPRDPAFRHRVLVAYEHRCAASGFRASLGERYFGCEAAHVQWHAYGGNDTVDNGIALEPTLHKLFDAGAWTLTDDCRILVSKQFTGSDEALDTLRPLHGRALRKPLDGEPALKVEHIRWHREEDLGGVFRHPALPL